MSVEGPVYAMGIRRKKGRWLSGTRYTLYVVRRIVRRVGFLVESIRYRLDRKEGWLSYKYTCRKYTPEYALRRICFFVEHVRVLSKGWLSYTYTLYCRQEG